MCLCGQCYVPPKTTPTDSLNEHALIFLDHAKNKNLSYSQRAFYNNKYLSTLLRHKNDSNNRKKICEAAEIFYNLNRWNELKFTLKELYNRGNTANDVKCVAKVYRFFGLLYENASINDS